jgi:hypothetical protein
MQQEAPVHFVYAKIVQPIAPTQRWEDYEDPLAEFLQQHELGEVTGGGTMQDRSGAALYAGIDLEVYDLDRALPLIAKKLAELGAPPGSELEYEINGKQATFPIIGPAR